MVDAHRSTANSAIIADRIVARTFTRELRTRHDRPKLERLERYRKQILATLRQACLTSEIGDEVTTKFRNLAENLEHTKAVAIVVEGEATEEEDMYGLQDTWNSLLDGDTAYGGRYIRYPEQLAVEPAMSRALFHPLLITLLAYRMGGAVNAVLTTQAHQWKLPEQLPFKDGLENFHTEGSEDGLFSDHRMTLVWEEQDGKARAVSGTHHVFRGSESLQSHVLQTAVHADAGTAALPMTILYDSKNSTIMYDCLEKAAVRHSISLNFSITAPDDEANFPLDCSEELHLEPTLSELLLGFPVPGYSQCFHKLLFEDQPLRAILEKLSDLRIPATTGVPSQDEDFLTKRWELHKLDNAAMIPPDIRVLSNDVSISHGHRSPALFLSALILKARRDVHLMLGADLVPQDAIEDIREPARKFIRDMPGVDVKIRFEKYIECLMDMSYSPRDLIPTQGLQEMANTIERSALHAAASGLLDDTGVLVSLPSFVGALGQALNGPKAVQMEVRPQLDDLDLQIYRTRCLYLFWCTDWLLEYLGKAKLGLCPIEAESHYLVFARQNLKVMGTKLVRNWVAWGMFVEGVRGA